MKKLLLILSLLLLVTCTIQRPIYKEGILISTEKVDFNNKNIVTLWRILTEQGDTIERYLIQVDDNIKSGKIVPYFTYKK